MNKWDERYRRGEHTQREPHPLVIEFAATLTPGRALDLACGTGRHALYLATRGWQVAAVDSSPVALNLLQEQAKQHGLKVNTCQADLERGEFVLEPDTYDLILVTCYLQRDLFPAMKASVKIGGAVLLVIALIDDDPRVSPMNPAFLLAPGELREAFVGWELWRDFEGKRPSREQQRAMAELVARRVQ